MQIKKKLRHIRRALLQNKFALNTIGFFAYLYAYLVGKTGKFEVQGIAELEKMITDNNGGIFVTWHGRALMLPFFWRNPRPMKALVSPHRDGRIIAELLRRFNILSIDGSTDRNAFGAALEIMKELRKGTTVALISDGPLGPRMRLNKSVIYFAQKTGKPIMGLTYSVQNCKIMEKSWDAMLLPKLFCKGKVAGTAPLFVPKDADEETLEQLRQKFENELNEITFRLDKECGLPPILPGAQKRKG